VRAHKPDIIHVTVSTYGHDGPRGGLRGFEYLGQALTGVTLRRGGGRPVRIQFHLCDYAVGHLAAMGVLLSLYRRGVTGEGQRVQASLVQAGTYMQTPFMVSSARHSWNEPSGPDVRGWGPLDRLYRGSDGWFYLAAKTPGDGDKVMAVAGIERIGDADLERVFAHERAAEWVERFLACGVAAHELLDSDTALDEPLLRAQGISVVVEHPGVGTVQSIGPAPRLSLTPLTVSLAAAPGSHTREIVAEAGLADRVDDLVQAKVVAETLPKDVALSL
jgi:crotonobetainyl-CoA:carnitine CoA-transferase CaiB-like acyl-CoA transferase